MSEYRDTSKSEIIRNIIHQWIEENPNTLKNNYAVDFMEINREIKVETEEIIIRLLTLASIGSRSA